jgi:hypothetical protein
MNEVVSSSINFTGYPDLKIFFELCNQVKSPVAALAG